MATLIELAEVETSFSLENARRAFLEEASVRHVSGPVTDATLDEQDEEFVESDFAAMALMLLAVHAGPRGLQIVL